MSGAGLVTTLLGFFCSGFIFAAALNIAPYFEIHGHRGARAVMPENTMAAFQYALLNGATALEMDLGVSRDNEVVINHDLSIDTDLCFSTQPSLRNLVKPLVNDLTLKQIKTYDCGSLGNSKFRRQLLIPGEKIPTLRELLRFLKRSPLPQAKKVKINLETKIEAENPAATLPPENFVNLVAKVILEEAFDPSRVILQSFDYRTIIYAKRKWPQLKTSALVQKIQSKKLIKQEVEKIIAETRADYISPNGSACSPELVKTSHAHGKKVVVWTINSAFHWRHFIKMGVDGIITDDPASLAHYLVPKK